MSAPIVVAPLFEKTLLEERELLLLTVVPDSLRASSPKLLAKPLARIIYIDDDDDDFYPRASVVVMFSEGSLLSFA